mmetsp:Transcript_2883/g.11671  ORF Transcript_2883/g.11671 Transcript_2883/m.11671 type:complete len:274 (+) Transcript_2883:1092-1913(+)
MHALPTSTHSARVGRGAYVMDSSICVAQMAGLPARLHLAISCFWIRKTRSSGTSMPRSPLATMMPSEALRMASKLSTPCLFSIFEMIWMFGPASARMASTCPASRMKDAKMKSAPSRLAQAMSSKSLSDTAGRSTGTPGRWTPLREPRMPPATTLHRTSPCERATLTTSRAITPSSSTTRCLGFTRSASRAQSTKTRSVLPDSRAEALVVSTISSPGASSSSASSLLMPVRISGPLVSKAMAHTSSRAPSLKSTLPAALIESTAARTVLTTFS